MNTMSGLNAKAKEEGTPSSSPTGGTPAEVDTRVPFHSVKAAIGLFGELSPKTNAHQRSKSSTDERVLEKETQHHLTIKELEGLKERLRSIEASKAQATKDLDKAKYSLDLLTSKLEALTESKQAAIVATEDAKKRLEELEEERTSNKGAKLVEDLRNQHKTSTAEISSVKQDITTLKLEFDAALQAKMAAFQEAAEAQHIIHENEQKAAELSKQLADLQSELNEVKQIAQQAQEEHTKLMAEKEARIQECKASKEDIENKIKALKEETGPNDKDASNEKLEQTNEAITLLTEQLNGARAADMEALNSITSELDLAKKELQQLESEQNSLTSLVESLKQTTDSETKAEELMKQAEAYKQEAEAARLATEETEKKLQLAMTEAKEAKEAINPESIIKLTAGEFSALKLKAAALHADADYKVASAKAQAETIQENHKPVVQKLEESQMENDALKIAIEDALKQAEMADSAREMVEGELRKWRRDQES